MLLTENRAFKAPLKLLRHREEISLSTYFPAGTTYFYGYPAGEDSGFLNRVVPKVEELVAARAFSCAGPKVSVVSFTATHSSMLGKNLLDELGIPRLSPKQVTLLPKEIDITVEGKQRNAVIMQALKKTVSPGHLVMAQPYTDKSVANLYQIPTQLTTWLNDKNNLDQYIPAEFVPRRCAVYLDGAQFAKKHAEIKLPSVVKASASSAGDGVYICQTKADLKQAVAELRDLTGAVLAEQYIEIKRNYGIHFGIPAAKDKSVDILGINEQLTSPQGEFLGGLINSTEFPEELADLETQLVREILPKIRELGWYGIGCFDVLTDSAGQAYIIDCNFRVTGMSAYHLLIVNQIMQTPLLGFSAEFTGTQAELEQILFPLAGRHSKCKYLQLIALSRHGDTWHFNAALSFNTPEQLQRRAILLLHMGLQSRALSQIIQEN
jgi:hypothetical protein